MRLGIIYLFGFFMAMQADILPLRILHISLHKGCIAEIQEVGRSLGWRLTSWYPFSSYQTAYHFLGIQEHPRCAYNMTAERALRIWQKHRDYFNSFDCIITSDIAPLSRIFLQNNFEKPLIIWICNRFNYCVGPGAEYGMDKEYYDLFSSAMKNSRVAIRAYTPFEHYFAALYGIDIRGPIIKPIGTRPKKCEQSFIPANVDKKNTLFIWPGYPGADERSVEWIRDKCSTLGFATYSGRFNGPDDLSDFKGIIYFPYQASNIALFENIQRGIIHFVPSERFVARLLKQGDLIYAWHEPYFCEWYFGEHRNIIVYFDSWDDLACKVATINYEEMRMRICEFAQYHRQNMLNKWEKTVTTILQD